MSLSLGQRLKIRTMIYVAGEPIPYFWPMRSFIHHNPLHGLEDLAFEDAVAEGQDLFHGRGYLSRAQYQRYLADGRADLEELQRGVDRFVTNRPDIEGIDLRHWLLSLLTDCGEPLGLTRTLTPASDVAAALAEQPLPADTVMDAAMLETRLGEILLDDRPVYEAVDSLFGTTVGAELDELVIKSCLDFFDEGQSVWGMPGREKGFFAAWRDVVKRNLRLFLRGLHVKDILAAGDAPEDVIAHVMHALQIPEDRWVGYFTREIARLHGWAGYIRWRSGTGQRYHWDEQFPGDLVDFVAVRLTLGLALLSECSRRRIGIGREAMRQAIGSRTTELYLRHELYGGDILPAMAARVERALIVGKTAEIDAVFEDYVVAKRNDEAIHQATRLRDFAQRIGEAAALDGLTADALGRLLDTIVVFERREGILWLRALEAHAMRELQGAITVAPPQQRQKRPFVQALFCIDTRSERIRRHLEGVGDYQTYGIAGFFGVPVSFIQLGKGSEQHLCPVLLTPKNLVLEMAMGEWRDDTALTALDKGLHGLKESVLTPFVTVEAVGLLFGFDMVGKTVAPQRYHRWRKHLHQQKPSTRLLLDKLSREQADSIVRAVQRAVIVKALEQDLGLEPERITDDMVRGLREAALEHDALAPDLRETLGLDEAAMSTFIDELRTGYRINPGFARQQLESLARIGFALDEQVKYVNQALSSIGLRRSFSRFVLLVGHGSTSDNNPYESALDCGACGGNHGHVSARVLAQMANKPEVRRKLRADGIDIADDVCFVAAMHNTTTDELKLLDLELLPPSHLVYLDRLHNGLVSASRLSAQERLPTLDETQRGLAPAAAYRGTQRNAVDWSQVRPEWGLSQNAYFVIGRRDLTRGASLDGRAFLHSYDYRVDPKRRLLENILTGPLVVGQWINMEHYFSTVDNERFGSGSKVYHNVAGRFGVMTGNLSDLRTGLPSQTVLKDGSPYHEPMRLITLIEAPLAHARRAVEGVVAVARLVHNGWIRLLVVDPESGRLSLFEDGEWHDQGPAHSGGIAAPDEPTQQQRAR